jgi:hypothetical protein
MPGEDLHLPEWVRFEAHWSACKARRPARCTKAQIEAADEHQCGLYLRLRTPWQAATQSNGLGSS